MLGLGVAAGAAVGQVQSSSATPTQWVENLVAATSAAGSARFRFTNVTTSPDQPQGQVESGTGVVDYTKGNFEVTQALEQQRLQSTNGGAPGRVEQVVRQETIAIGQNVYTRFDIAAPFSGWSKVRFPRRVHLTFGLDAASGAEDSVAQLAGFTPTHAVRALGPGLVNGVATSRYAVVNEPLYVCGAHGRTLAVELPPSITVWVDGQGRLVKIRTTSHTKASTAHGPPDAGGPQTFTVPASTQVSTLTFSDFGSPVHIAAPAVSPSSSSSSIGLLKAKQSTTPCHT